MKNKIRFILLCIFVLICNLSIAQNFSKDARLLSAKLTDYLASGDLMDTKENSKAITKIIKRINEKKDTTSVVVLIDVYLTYDAFESDIKDLAYLTLINFKKQALPLVIDKLNLVEVKYGNQKNKQTDYMDLMALKNKLISK